MESRRTRRWERISMVDDLMDGTYAETKKGWKTEKNGRFGF